MDENLTKLTVVDENGENCEIEIIDIFQIEKYPGKEYVLYTKGNVQGEYLETYASVLIETEDSVTLAAISDEQEFQDVQEHINKSLEEVGE